MPRSRWRFRLTRKSPVLASVTAARPNWRPVRRERLSTSGVVDEDLFDAEQYLIGICQRGAGGHQVVEDEAAFVHFRQQIAAERVVAEIGNHDEAGGAESQHQRTRQGEAKRAAVDAGEAAHHAAWWPRRERSAERSDAPELRLSR